MYGQGRPHLSFDQLRSTKVVLPPLEEQARIVEEVERQTSVIEQMEASIAAGPKRADRMRQSILHQAFTSQLVPQDPNDEPASILLDRIRAERTAAPPNCRCNRA
jgi:type I restriction enzyme S subunit